MSTSSNSPPTAVPDRDARVRRLRARARALEAEAARLESAVRDVVGRLASLRTAVKLVHDELDEMQPAPTAAT